MPAHKPIPHDFAAVALSLTNDELMARYGADRTTVRAWRKTTGLHQPRGRRTLPIPGQWDTTMTLGALCRLHGWGSPSKFSARLKARRPEIHARAVANGRKASLDGLRAQWREL